MPNTIGSTTPLRANGKWYVFGTNGFMTSANGTAWTTTYTESGYGGFNIAWTGSLFVAAAGFGHVATSPDGVTWTERPSGSSDWVNALLWTGTRLVITGTTSVLTSADGITWTSHALPEAQQDLRDIVWTGNRARAAS